jgi:hypothetical protein
MMKSKQTVAGGWRSPSLRLGPVQVSLWKAPVGTIGVTWLVWRTRVTLELSFRRDLPQGISATNVAS